MPVEVYVIGGLLLFGLFVLLVSTANRPQWPSASYVIVPAPTPESSSGAGSAGVILLIMLVAVILVIAGNG